MADLSKPYDSAVDAVIGGFKKIMANGVQWHSNEYGFWVVSRPGPAKKPAFHYTKPETNDAGYVDGTLPSGGPVFARCHSHPKSTKTGDFSTGDKRQFEKVRKARPGIDWYLLNPSGQIRRASTADDFPAGVPVPWNDKIKP